MTRVEFIAARLRARDHYDRHVWAPLPLWQTVPVVERHRWIKLAEAALDADASWKPGERSSACQ